MKFINMIITAGTILMLGGNAAAERYLDSTFAYSSLDTVYGRNTTVQNESQDLVMRIFVPENDTVSRRPAVIWMHGGAFIIGQYLSADCVALCKQLAGCGYVTATIEYRLGVARTGDENENFKDALYRGTQDQKAAVRFMRKHAARFGVDTSLIVIGGASAGGIATDAYLYWDESEVGTDRVTRLGNYDASGSPGISNAIAGAVPWAGCVFDTAMLNPVDMPVIAMHDTGDGSIPYTSGPAPRYPDITFYGDGHPAVVREAGSNFHLVTFYGNDHVPSPTGTSYRAWLDSTRINIYERIVAPGQTAAMDARSVPAVEPGYTGQLPDGVFYDMRGRCYNGSGAGGLPRGIYVSVHPDGIRKVLR